MTYFVTAEGTLVESSGMADIPDGWTMLPDREGRRRWEDNHRQAHDTFAQAVAEAEAEAEARMPRRMELLERLAVLLECDVDEAAGLLGVPVRPGTQPPVVC